MEHPPSFDDGREPFDHHFARELIGKHVLAGVIEWLPPQTSVFQKARAGEYRLKTAGEVVTDPDYTTMWTLTQPKPE